MIRRATGIFVITTFFDGAMRATLPAVTDYSGPESAATNKPCAISRYMLSHASIIEVTAGLAIRHHHIRLHGVGVMLVRRMRLLTVWE